MAFLRREKREAPPPPSQPTSRPWPRERVDEAEWSGLFHEIAKGASDMLSLWSDGEAVYVALYTEAAGVRIVSLDCVDGAFPSAGRHHPPAIRLERAICDLYGLEATGAADRRRWLDHGRWGVRSPLGRREALDTNSDAYAFLPVEGPIHQIPVGPVHAGIIEPGHFRFSANGETVVRLEERLGFVHKGVNRLMTGASIERAGKLAARVSGDSTVGYGVAFTHAVEAALGVEAPPRALYLRVLMAELERLANHFGDIGAICNDAAFSLMHAHTSVVRERILRACAACFGHRLMMDSVIPGGVSTDLTPEGMTALRELIDWIRLLLPRLVAVYGDTTSLQDRTVATGVVSRELVAQYACGGFIGRASGRRFDARRAIGYAAYPALSFEVGAATEGDVDARVWVRFDEVKASLQIVEQVLDLLPHGSIAQELPSSDGQRREGAALVEGFRGDIFAWVRIGDGGTVETAHLRDPSWFQWPLLEAAIKGNIVADFPLCNKSFNCSYSGHDL